MGAETTESRRNDPSFDRPIIAAGADFRLRGTPATGKDHGANDIQVPAECKPDVEIGILFLSHGNIALA